MIGYPHHRFAAAGLLIVLLAVESFSQSRTCTIKGLVGIVKMRRGENSAWIDAKTRMPLREKDAIRTFIESEVELETSEGSIMKIGENATLELSKLQERGTVQSTKVKVLSGSVVSNIKKLMDTRSNFDFETPTALASIRGTVLGLSVSGERTEIKVYEGRVLVIPAGAREGKELAGNQMASIVKGQKTFEILKLEERPPLGVKDSVSPLLDSSLTPRPDSLQKGDSSLLQEGSDTAGSGPLRLTVSSPANGGIVSPAATVVVSGSVRPEGATVAVNGKPAQVTAGGIVKTQLTAPSAPGEFDIIIVATFDGSSQTVSRRVMVEVRTLQLQVASPANDQRYSKPIIPVNGTATPGAEVSITPPGVRIPILANGVFSTQAPLPDEVGEYTIEIEATLQGAVQKVMRKVTYRPEIQFTLATPQNRQTVSSIMFAVKGTVLPARNAEVSVLGRKMAIAADGTFSGMVSIPDEEGEVQLDFEVSAGGTTQTVTRTVVYKRAVDTYAPVLQATLPKFAKQRQLCLPVYDRTSGDEVTFYYQIDGARDYQKGSGTGTYCFNLEPGIHEVVVWAEDLARNQSQRLSERIAYVETSSWYIKIRKPAGEEVIRIPPSPPGDLFEPAYKVDFSIENLPGDDMRLIREVRVINQTTGNRALTQSVFTDHYLDFDIPLKPGRTNVIIIEVQDCNGNKKVAQCLIHLK